MRPGGRQAVGLVAVADRGLADLRLQGEPLREAGGEVGDLPGEGGQQLLLVDFDGGAPAGGELGNLPGQLVEAEVLHGVEDAVLHAALGVLRRFLERLEALDLGVAGGLGCRELPEEDAVAVHLAGKGLGGEGESFFDFRRDFAAVFFQEGLDAGLLRCELVKIHVFGVFEGLICRLISCDDALDFAVGRAPQ